MKYFWIILIFAVFTSCSQASSREEVNSTSKSTQVDSANVEETVAEAPQPDRLTVMVIPCSNGYEYNLKMGDVNPSLEKYLSQDERIILKPFPLKEMRGTGYFGVFDKKDCAKILEKVEVDFLIMTRMRGSDLTSVNSDSGDWGYDTKIVEVETMDQFNGISAKKLTSFELIDSDVRSKMDELVTMMVESRED